MTDRTEATPPFSRCSKTPGRWNTPDPGQLSPESKSALSSIAFLHLSPRREYAACVGSPSLTQPTQPDLEPTLLDDLLEASDAIYHRAVASLQVQQHALFLQFAK